MRTQQAQPPQPSTAQPVVLVVNPPTIDPGQQCYTRHPYLNRGAQFSNGCRCLLPQMVLLCTLGGMMLFIGLINSIIGLQAGIIFMVPGGMLLGVGIYLMCTAKKQFESLPPDHPDRVKYAARNINHVSGPTVYALPPMQNQVMTDPSVMGGQAYHIMPVSSGNSAPITGVDGVPIQYIVPAGQGYPYTPAAPSGRNVPQNAYVPENDPPPPYSDVVHNI